MDFIHICTAQHEGAYRIALSFNDGSKGVADLSEELEGPVFEPLRDFDYFKKFQLIGPTLEWPNGADFAPEFLYQLAHAREAALA